MYIARERGNERSDEVISYGCLPFECSRRKVDYNIIRIVGENFLFIGAFPGIEILLNKCSDAFWRRLGSCNLHTCSLLDAAIASSLGQLYTRWRTPMRQQQRIRPSRTRSASSKQATGYRRKSLKTNCSRMWCARGDSNSRPSGSVASRPTLPNLARADASEAKSV